MKKLFTIDDFIIALISAVGYGFCFEVPKILGYPEWVGIAVCLVVGMTIEGAVQKLIFSEKIQSKFSYKLTAFATLILISGIALHFATNVIGISITDYVEEQFQFVIVPPIIFFLFNLAVRWYRIKKIRERYGDGSEGFLVDDAFKQSDFEQMNRQNKLIEGKYDKKCAVKTKNGVFVGRKEKNMIFFTGVPYAKPPIGELRWKAPEPLPESNEVFEAQYFGASAIQVDYDGSFLKNHRQSEDCLTLNICVGVKKSKQHKPVVVLFHHGDFSYGGSANPLLHGENFIKLYPDAIGVSFNYRLGILGFMDFSEIPGGEKYPDTLNLGLLDQIAALRWIKENISAFGGDPEKITVMGFEAGAVSISMLTTSKQAQGLFKKAFIFYGNPLMSYQTPEVSKKLAQKLLQETSTTSMEELLQLPAEKLKEVQEKLVMELSFGPTRDDKMFPYDIFAAYRAGIASDVEFIIGIPSNERQIYKSFVGSEKYELFIDQELEDIFVFLNEFYPDSVEDVKNYIKAQSEKMPLLEVKAKLYEYFNALGTYFNAKNLANSGNKVHLLYWNVKPLIENLGSGTVDVMATFLGSLKAVQIYGNVLQQDIAETLQKLFKKFESGEEIRLFNNEIKGMKAIDWKEFPNALIVSEKEFKCEKITKKLTDIKSLLEFIED